MKTFDRRTFLAGSGALTDRRDGRARNLPVPAGFNDSELSFLLREAVLPIARGFTPEAIVVTCGADALAGDPLSRLELSNVALCDAVEGLVALCPRAVVLGGGGYNPWTLSRCWTGLWGRLSGRDVEIELPPDARALLAGFECDLVDEEESDPRWLTHLWDERKEGPVRDEIRHIAQIVTRP